MDTWTLHGCPRPAGAFWSVGVHSRRVNRLGSMSRGGVSILLASDFGMWETLARSGRDVEFEGLPPGLYRVSVAGEVEPPDP